MQKFLSRVRGIFNAMPTVDCTSNALGFFISKTARFFKVLTTPYTTCNDLIYLQCLKPLTTPYQMFQVVKKESNYKEWIRTLKFDYIHVIINMYCQTHDSLAAPKTLPIDQVSPEKETRLALYV